MATETKTVRRRIKQEEVVAYICDRCKKRIGMDDWIERQEMLRWRMTGGYGSIFGDGNHLSLDLCQSCAKDLLGDLIQVVVDEPHFC